MMMMTMTRTGLYNSTKTHSVVVQQNTKYASSLLYKILAGIVAVVLVTTSSNESTNTNTAKVVVVNAFLYPSSWHTSNIIRLKFKNTESIDETGFVTGLKFNVTPPETKSVAKTNTTTSIGKSCSSYSYDAATTSTNVASEKLVAQMEKLAQPRPLGLFLAEKVVESVEGMVNGIVHSLLGPQPKTSNSNKERIIVLGTGWGGASFVKNINAKNLYDVTVISPRNHFEFTPMLTGASVGTVEFRSICEPIRDVNPHVKYLEAYATNVDPITKHVFCEAVVCHDNKSFCEVQETFTVPYDQLIVTVGAQTNTFGIEGVEENCMFLKQVDDARRIRTSIVNCFEHANLPDCSTDEDRIRTLTFAVIGAGPAGIEFASELRDFIEQDGPKYYPNLLKYVRIKVIEASNTVLKPFDKSLQLEAIARLNRQAHIKDRKVLDLLPKRFHLTELLLNTSVKGVDETHITIADGTKIPYGLAVWAGGNGQLPFTADVIGQLGLEQQLEQNQARGRLATDPWLRVRGCSNGTILAFGDCACITTQPFLPPTAQVALQQGEYVASLLNKKYSFSPTKIIVPTNVEEDKTMIPSFVTAINNTILPPPVRESQQGLQSLFNMIANSTTIRGTKINYAKAFQFLDFGILAYTGDGTALAQVTIPPIKEKGKIGNVIWKSVYLYKQISMRNRMLVLTDWMKRCLFGRDITRL